MSGQRQFPPGGVLFNAKSKKSDRSPDMTGSLEISKELLKDLVDRANKGEKIVMDLISYKKDHPKWGEFLSLKANVLRPKFQSGGASSNAQRNDDPPF